MNNELNQKLLQVSAAMMELCTAINTLQKEMVTLFASLPDDFKTSAPNTVGIDPVINVALQIANATDLELKYLNPSECNFGYKDKNGNFREVYRLLKTWIKEWIECDVANIEIKRSVKHITQELNTLNHKEYSTGKSVPSQIVTPQSIAEAIASATNLELKVDSHRFQIGYQYPLAQFVIVAEFSHDYIAARIANKTVGEWMKNIVTQTIDAVADDEAVAEYRKRKMVTEYDKALESIPKAQRTTLIKSGERSKFDFAVSQIIKPYPPLNG